MTAPSGFTVRVDQNRYLPVGGARVDAVVTVSGDAMTAPEHGPDALVVFVADCSSSTEGPVLAAVRRAVATAIARLPDGVPFAVIAGSGPGRAAYPEAGAAVAGPRSRAEAVLAVRQLPAAGAADIGSWLGLVARIAEGHHGPRACALLLTAATDVVRPDGPGDRRVAFHCDCRVVGSAPAGRDLDLLATVLRERGALGSLEVVAEPADLVTEVLAVVDAATEMRPRELVLRLWTPRTAVVRSVRQVAPTDTDLAERRIEAGPQHSDYPLGAWRVESRDYLIAIEVVPGVVGEVMRAGRVEVLRAGSDDVLAQGEITATWTDDPGPAARISSRVAGYTAQAELAAAIAEGLAARAAGDGERAADRLGRAVALAREVGRSDTLRLLERLVEVDPATGTARLRRGVTDEEERELDARSARRGRLRARRRRPSPAPGPPPTGPPPFPGRVPSLDEVRERRPPREEQPSAPPRHVNTLVWTGDGVLAGPSAPIPAGAAFVVGIGVGARDRASVLPDRSQFPDAVVGRGARRLDVYARRTDGPADPGRHARLYLPPSGDAFTCPVADALPDGTAWETVDHTPCTPRHGRHAEFRYDPLEPGDTAAVDVLVYVGAAAVHKQVLEVGTSPGTGVRSSTAFTLTRFARLPDLIDRAVSIDDAADRLTINHLGPRDPAVGVRRGDMRTFGFRVDPPQWSAAAARFRRVLTGIYFTEGADGTWAARYRPGRPLPEPAYVDALVRMATVGRSLYNNLFPTADSRGLDTLLRHEAVAQGRPATVQVARTVQRPFVVPWQGVYDLPMEHADEELWECPSVRRYGPAGGATGPVPAHCPEVSWHEAARTADSRPAVLCPFGFWGLAQVLEVPEPPPHRDLDAVVCDGHRAPAALTGAGASLDQAALRTHVRRLQEIPGFADRSVVTTARGLRDALAASTMDIIYLLCHAERVPSSATVAPTMRLEFSDRCVTSDDIATWARDEWAVDHWSGRRPLVVLNACQTSEIVQSSMNTFVSNFMGAGASGIVGSETLLEQRVAAHAMEVFLREFCAGAPVGTAIRTMRWELLAAGSLLGLAYTAYCSADLRLRDRPRPRPDRVH